MNTPDKFHSSSKFKSSKSNKSNKPEPKLKSKFELKLKPNSNSLQSFSLSPKEQLDAICTYIQDLEILSKGELLEKLEFSYKNKKPLRVKLGFDPSYPDLHLGHSIVLGLMSLFQNLGHQAIFVVGDFTAMIGDPSGRNQTRPILSEEQVQENARTYTEQVSKVLDMDKAVIAYNSTWMKSMSLKEFINLASQCTVARMLERDDFTKRFKERKPISIHEFFYPLMQAYDSYMLKADLELGGTDQRFNLLMGREIQRASNHLPQCLLMVPLLEGLDGLQKMSKSLDNHIALCDEPKEMFGKVMKLSDDMMIRYYHLLSGLGDTDLQKWEKELRAEKRHPKEEKINLAKIIVSRFHDDSATKSAAEEFQRIFTKKELPKNLPEFSLSVSKKKGKIWAGDLLLDLGWVQSKTEARQFIKSGAVYRDGNKIVDIKHSWGLKKGEKFVIRLGKRKFMKIKVV